MSLNMVAVNLSLDEFLAPQKRSSDVSTAANSTEAMSCSSSECSSDSPRGNWLEILTLAVEGNCDICSPRSSQKQEAEAALKKEQRTYEYQISQFLKNGLALEAFGLIMMLSQRNIVPTKAMCAPTIAQLSKQKHWSEALTLIGLMGQVEANTGLNQTMLTQSAFPSQSAARSQQVAMQQMANQQAMERRAMEQQMAVAYHQQMVANYQMMAAWNHCMVY